MPDEPIIDDANTRALVALLGWETDWRKPLVNLLRSDTPINPIVRCFLADAIEGRHPAGIEIKLAGHQEQSRRLEGLCARREWLELGRKVYPFVEASARIQDAWPLAAEALGVDEDSCRKRYYYTKNFLAWLASARASTGRLATSSEAELADVWHYASIDQGRDMKPNMPTAEQYNARIHEQESFLEEAVADWKSPALALEVLLSLMRLYRAEKP